MQAFKFRPSSHSDDYTVIASFNSPQDASLAFSALEIMLEDMRDNPEDYATDWRPNEASVRINEKRVRFDVNTAGHLSEVANLMRKLGALNIEVYERYQKIRICFEAPAGVPLEAAALLLDKDEVDAVSWLLKNCGKPAAEEDGATRRYIWTYSGDGIYDEEENMLFLGEVVLELDGRENWHVELEDDEWGSHEEDCDA